MWGSDLAASTAAKARVVVLLCAAAVAISPASGTAGGLTLGHPYPASGPVNDWANQIAACIGQRLGIGVGIYGEGRLGSAEALPKAVIGGQVEIAILPAIWMSDAWPAIGVLASPGVVSDPKKAMHLAGDAELMRAMDSLGAEAAGFHVVGLGWQYGVIVGRKAPLDNVGGSKIGTISPPFRDLLKRLGASTVRIPASEVPTALQYGVIDAAVMSMDQAQTLQRGFGEKGGGDLTVAWSEDFTPFLSPILVVASAQGAKNWGGELVETLRVGCIAASTTFNDASFGASLAAIAVVKNRGGTIQPFEESVRPDWRSTMDDALRHRSERLGARELVDRIAAHTQ